MSSQTGPKAWMSGGYGRVPQAPLNSISTRSTPPRAGQSPADRKSEHQKRLAAPAAEQRATQLQHQQLIHLRRRMNQQSPRVTLKRISQHPLFPFSYDRLAKQFRGDNSLSWAMLGAVLNVLDELDRPTDAP